MINEDTSLYLKNLVLDKSNKYEKYICHTNTSVNYNDNIYDITCVFTDNISSLNHYQTSINTGLVCNIDTNSYYYNSTNKLERIKCLTGSYNKTINNYEVIYTNMSDDFPSLLAKEEYEHMNNVGYNLDLNYFYLIILFLSIFLVIYFLSKIFRIR